MSEKDDKAEAALGKFLEQLPELVSAILDYLRSKRNEADARAKAIRQNIL